ncbi:uncharacterized protein LOC117780773 [Drosophila innubila]|uniref:uncharacterized protein LOC117780773 n=1 Tax=Drosophila innubila TaxID=198719 RepID=UPI00148CF056|nr:uncharacterized protein LOC117780773 [Drosophila innubila]
MAWAPSTNFEDDLVNLQPDFNLIHGQLAYEANRNKNYTPLPKSTYEHLANREKRNEEIQKSNISKTKQISDSLELMERIQQIAGTRPLGEHATMADWDDQSTVEQEAVAMMRHFGMMSMAGGSLTPLEDEKLPEKKFLILRNGNKSFPVILDPSYFESGRKRKTPNQNNNLASSTNLNDSSSSTAKTYLDDIINSKISFDAIPCEVLQKLKLEEILLLMKTNAKTKQTKPLFD